MESKAKDKPQFESPDLTDIAFLSCQGLPVSPAFLRGRLVFFRVPVSTAEAEALLKSPEHKIVSRFFAEWQRLRRLVDQYRAEPMR